VLCPGVFSYWHSGSGTQSPSGLWPIVAPSALDKERSAGLESRPLKKWVASKLRKAGVAEMTLRAVETTSSTSSRPPQDQAS